MVLPSVDVARRNKRRPSKRARGVTADPSVRVLPPPKTRLRPLFKTVGAVIEAADGAVLATRESTDPLVRFDAGVLLRAVNALKSIRLLIEHAHWEFASAAARQLFELVVNMEHVGRADDRAEATLRYAKYGLFQLVRHQHETALYDQKTGRPVDEDRLAQLKSMLDHTFPEFRNEKNGKVRWARSWSSRTTRELAELSEHPLRMDQYCLLFATWSEQTHGSPGALIDNFFPSPGGAGAIEDVVADDERRIIEIAMISISLAVELWMLFTHVQGPTPAQAKQWMEELQRFAARFGPAA